MPETDLLWERYFDAEEAIPQEAIPVPRDVPWSHIINTFSNDDLARRIQWMIHAHNKRTAPMLEDHRPSAPQRPGKYELRVLRDDGGFSIFIYRTVYAMRKTLDILLDGRDFDWINKSTIRCDNLIIKSKYLARYVTYKLNSEEEAWLLPFPDCYYARAIAFKETYTEALNSLEERSLYQSSSKAKQSNSDRSSQSSRRKKRKQRDDDTADAPSPKSKRASKRSSQPKGETFGPGEIASHLGILASKARQLLRAKMTKPQGGWEWPVAEFEEIIQVLR